MPYVITDDEVRQVAEAVTEHGRKKACELLGLSRHQVEKRLERAKQIGLYRPNPNLARWLPGEDPREIRPLVVGEWIEANDVAGPIERIEDAQVYYRCGETGRLVKAWQHLARPVPSPDKLERIHNARRQQFLERRDRNAKRARVRIAKE